jgi:hypothetical protein
MLIARRQAAVLDQLRARANIVLSATAIVSSLLATDVLRAPHPFGLVVSALATFGLGVGCCVAVLFPVRDGGPLPCEHKLNEINERNASGRGKELLPAGLNRACCWKVSLTTSDIRAIRRGSDGNVVAMDDEFSRILGDAAIVNRFMIGRRTDLFQIACILLVVQILLWSLAIWL